MSKFTIDFGHCLFGYDTGCSFNGRREEILTRETGKLVVAKLQKLGHTVLAIDLEKANSVTESLNYRIGKINSFTPDLSISIHINAGKGLGTEIYTDGYNADIANKILANFVELGFRNRGIKNGSGLALVGSVKPYAMLIECCFIDSEDINNYNAEKFSDAIVKGLVGTTVSLTPVVTQQSTSEYRVNAYNEKGVFTCNVEAINFRNNPLISSSNPVVDKYYKGETVNYDYVYITNLYVYISWISRSGIRRYMPVRDKSNGEVWGTFK